MSENRERHGAARMFLSLAGDQAAVEQDQRSPLRKAGIVFLAFLFISATPLYWVATATGHDGSDAPIATKSSSGPGSGDEDEDEDSSGPGSDGDGDDETDDGDTTDTSSVQTGATTTDATGAETNEVTAGDTQGDTGVSTDGATGTDTAATGDATAQDTGNSTAAQTRKETRGATAGGTQGDTGASTAGKTGSPTFTNTGTGTREGSTPARTRTEGGRGASRGRRACGGYIAAMFRQLLPEPAELLDGAAVVESLDFGELAHDDRPYLVLNMVTTADGRVTIGGRSGPIGNEADQDLFHALRTRVDAVMVGAGTLRAERYGRLVRKPERREARVRAGLAPDPLAVIVSGRLDLPHDLPLLHEPDQEVLVATFSNEELPGAAAIRYTRWGGGAVDMKRLLAILRGRGVRSVLCEGGPTLNAELLRAGGVDELFHCMAPKLAGEPDAPTMVSGVLHETTGMELVALLENESHLFMRYRLSRV